MTKNTEKPKLVASLKLSPLASRTHALLILSSYNILDFEAISLFIGASKSSSAVNTSVLIPLNLMDLYA
ncbi:hypothetical protein [Cellulophaga sp. Hel_I_12]|uniref:hypothetical protein n=1 Tax=Cellulophaga sp. Hel_I_12 TaxID=1249972 RepID=UPI000A803EB3|nr:hypothetical protein [Cellulophaga sp. Hel_I_12]